MASASPWASQARINSLLRYAPQREVLLNAAHEARQNYAGAIAGAQSDARLTSSAVEQAKPQVAGSYERAQGAASSTQAQLQAALAALGPAAGGFKAAAATESAGGQEKTGRERATAEADLTAQDVAAKSGPAYARTLATQQRETSLSKILASLQGVAGNEGLAAASEVGKLSAEANRNRLTERGQNITQSDAAASRSQKAAEHKEDIEAKKAATNGSGIKFLPLTAQGKAATTLRDIEKEARELHHGQRLSRAAIYSELTTPQESTNQPKTTLNPKTGKLEEIKNSKGEVQYEKVPAVKAHDALLAEAALDSVFGYGRVSRGTLQKLHRAGYSLAALGLEGPAPVQPIQQVQSTAPGHRIAAERGR